MLGLRYSTEDGKAVVRRVSESEQSVVRVSTRLSLYTSLLPQSVRLFLLCLTLAVSLCFHFCSLAQRTAPALFQLSHKLFHTSIASCTMWPLLHFGSRTIFFTRWSPPGWFSTTWLVVWGRDHRNCAHAIKVWRIYIYIYTNANWPHCTISSLTLRRSAMSDYWTQCHFGIVKASIMLLWSVLLWALLLYSFVLCRYSTTWFINWDDHL